MLLGKRQRPPMRRTTSMTEFAADVVLTDVEVMQQPFDQEKVSNTLHHQRDQSRERQTASDWLETKNLGNPAAPSPRGGRCPRNSAELVVVDTAPFLRACGLCKRRLGPGQDTFMYRGDAFCSFECRQQHITQDELQEKCSLTSMKDTSTATTGSEQAGDSEMVAAA
ncbi:unnamed protein product [Musa acuminata subsp. burmannicoides]